MGESHDRFVPMVSLALAIVAVGVAVSTVSNPGSPVRSVQNSPIAPYSGGEQNLSTPPEPSPPNNIQAPSAAAQPEGSYTLVAGSACRRVLYDGSVYADPNPSSAVVVPTLYAGQQVGYDGSTPSLGPDGNNYIRVSIPYAATEPTVGFMRSQIQTAGGQFVSTLALCDSTNPSPSPQPPINGRW